MVKNPRITIVILISSLFSSCAFAHMGEWGEKRRFGSTTCTHITRNSGWNDLASLSVEYTIGSCIPTETPVDPCFTYPGTDEVKISINKNSANPELKTQILTSNDWLKQENPNFPIIMLLNTTLKRGQTKTLAKIIAAPRSQFICRIGT